MKWTQLRQADTLERGFWKYLHRVRLTYILKQIEAERLPHGRSLRILDVGCGDGVITLQLRAHGVNDFIEGVDLDAVRLERARQACPSMRFQRVDATALPYPDGWADVVLCHHLIEHVPDDVQVLRECGRVVRPGGLLILGIPHEGGRIGRLLRTLHRRMYADGEHVHFYTIGDMRGLLEAQGFLGICYAKFGLLLPQYHAHVLWTWNRWTFAVGHWISQRVDATADSLIFTARRPDGRIISAPAVMATEGAV